ncbi:MAG: DUF1549 and DUF1553 domain-containing protein, partial [Verrucomicrobiales bacterium]|nr:DUF1549 and DUF1553 domain-containing protein [Verrucomicrobiales bacterium]
PPAPEVVEAFVSDEDPRAFDKVVDGLLELPQYGERWGRHWLDVARYSDGMGGFLDGKDLPDAWRYRDWVVGALNRDLGYDEFVRQQIAGDVLGAGEEKVGTGFFAVGPTYNSDGGDPEAKAQAEAETLADRVDTFSRAFVGLTVACARCHDHKFDPVTTEDYYALAGIFRNSRTVEHPLVEPEVVATYNAAQQAIREKDKAINQWLDAKSKELGIERGKVEREMGEGLKAELVAKRKEVEAAKKAAPAKYDVAHGIGETGSGDMHVAIRGDLRKKGELVKRRFLEVIAGTEAEGYAEGSGRRALADAVVAGDNPLTARVMVNRVWMGHFGKALVRSPSNFGVLGEEPTHPGLLDWLAAAFMENGWSLKALHREILLSSTWQMSSQFRAGAFDRDGDNRLIWRMNPRRLDVEVWRDSLLAVTGELDGTLGGRPTDRILESKRRTLYAKISRNGDRFLSDEFLRIFDFPTPRSTSPGRVESTVPQQFLFVMNSPFMLGRAKALAERVGREAGEGEAARIRRAYALLFAREPSEVEIEVGRAYLGEAAEEGAPPRWESYAQVLLGTQELMQMP